jgi:hypothetical protein
LRLPKQFKIFELSALLFEDKERERVVLENSARLLIYSPSDEVHDKAMAFTLSKLI